MLRICVGIRRLENTDISLARFVDCIVNIFKKESGHVRVNCKLENNQLILSQSKSHSVNTLIPLTYESDYLENVVLYHSPICPLYMIENENINNFSSEYLHRGIEVAVCVLLESRDKKILLTQRSSTMRSFPNNWVPPGGHLEKNETFLEAGLRELEEETGLKLNPTNSNSSIMCLWESVFPVILNHGLPKKHHLVIYLLTKANETSDVLQNQIKLEIEEVQAFAWINRDIVKKLCSGQDEIIEKYAINSSGVLEKNLVKLSKMFSLEVWTSNTFFTGTQAALKFWLNSKNHVTFNNKL